MSISSQKRAVRIAVLVLYGLAVGVGQGWHYFAHSDACHGVHTAGQHTCGCGGCTDDSPFAAFRRAQLASDHGEPSLRPGGHTGHQCHECTICQTLAQMVGDEPTTESPQLVGEFLEYACDLSDSIAPSVTERYTDARGPPCFLATV